MGKSGFFTVTAFGICTGLLFGGSILASAQTVRITGETCEMTVWTWNDAREDEAEEDTAQTEPDEEAETSGQSGQGVQDASDADDSAQNMSAEIMGTSFEPIVWELTEFETLGVVEEEWIAIEQDGSFAFLARDDVRESLQHFDSFSLPTDEAVTVYGKGDRGDDVQEIQDWLIALEYLDGPSDGIFGNNTEASLLKFQTEMGLLQTSVADAPTQWLLEALGTAAEDTTEAEEAEAAEEENGTEGAGESGTDSAEENGTESAEENAEVLVLEYPSVLTVEEKFAPILADTDLNLEAFLDPSWELSYDIYSGEGELDPGIVLGTYSVEEPDVERIQMEARLVILLIRGEDDVLSLVPVVEVTSVGAYRPGVLQAWIRISDQVVTLPVLESTGSLDGSMVQETIRLGFTEEAADFLQTAESDGLTIVLGGGETYRLTLSTGMDELLSLVQTCEDVGIVYVSAETAEE